MGVMHGGDQLSAPIPMHPPNPPPHPRPLPTPLPPGGALIKYGSLLLDVPFQPNPVLAVAVVLGVPGAFAVKILTTGRM
jgi:hypothetical protein